MPSAVLEWATDNAITLVVAGVQCICARERACRIRHGSTDMRFASRRE